MNPISQRRQPAGVPVGGQYAASVHSETDVTLDDYIELRDFPDQIREINDEIASLNRQINEIKQDQVVVSSPETYALDRRIEQKLREAGEMVDREILDRMTLPVPTPPSVEELEAAELETAAAFEEFRRARQTVWDLGPDSNDNEQFSSLVTEVDRLHGIYDEHRNHLGEMRGGAAQKEWREQYAATAIQVLSEVRPFGDPDGIHSFHTNSTKTGIKALTGHLRFFPTDWIKSSADYEHPLVVKTTRGRAGYTLNKLVRLKGEPRKAKLEHRVRCQSAEERATALERYSVGDVMRAYGGNGRSLIQMRVVAVRPSDTDHSIEVDLEAVRATRPNVGLGRTAVLTTDKSVACTVHEFAHRSEAAHPNLARMEQLFLQRRCGDDQGRMPQTVGLFGGRSERYFPGGDFVDDYVAKDYKNASAYEVMSVGVAAIFGSENGALHGVGHERADTDHAAFVLGALAVL